MKKIWKEIANVDLNAQERDLMSEYYPLAYRIASRFKSHLISDDIKENIAFNALQRAVKAYNPNKNTKFSTFLYLCIMNNLKSEVQRAHRLPNQVSEVADPLTQEYTNIFELLLPTSKLENYDWNQFNQFVNRLKSKLNDRRKLMLDMLIDPEQYLEKCSKQFKLKRIPKHMTYSIMAKVIGRSVAKIAIDMKGIREQAKKTLKEFGEVYE
jgi:RNA polymerase sigma factor (sigma-70 family)